MEKKNLNPTVTDETVVDAEQLNPTVTDETVVDAEQSRAEIDRQRLEKLVQPQPLTLEAWLQSLGGLRLTVHLKFQHTEFKSSDEFLNKDGSYGTYASNMSLENGNLAVQNGADFQFFARLKNLHQLEEMSNPYCMTEVRFYLDGPYFLPHPKHYEVEVDTEYFSTLPESWRGGVQFIHMNQDAAQ